MKNLLGLGSGGLIMNCELRIGGDLFCEAKLFNSQFLILNSQLKKIAKLAIFFDSFLHIFLRSLLQFFPN